MSAGAVIFQLLNNNVNTTGTTKALVFPDVAPQLYTRPCIVYSEVSKIPNNTLGTAGTSSLDTSRIQISIAATTRAQCDSMGDQVRTLLDYINQQTIVGNYVDWISFDSQNTFFDQGAGQDGLYILNQDYKISIRR